MFVAPAEHPWIGGATVSASAAAPYVARTLCLFRNWMISASSARLDGVRRYRS